MAKSKLIENTSHADLTYKIIGGAMAVHRNLRPGHGEKIYQKRLEQEFQLLLNFGGRSLVYRRILPPKRVIQHRINYQWLFVPDRLNNKSV